MVCVFSRDLHIYMPLESLTARLLSKQKCLKATGCQCCFSRRGVMCPDFCLWRTSLAALFSTFCRRFSEDCVVS